MFIAALLSRPPEEIEGEIGVRLGLQSLVDIGRGESGLELLDPCFELLLERSLGANFLDWEVKIFGGLRRKNSGW